MLVGVFKTWEWALQNGWHHRLLYRNVICARVCSPVLKRTRVYRLLSNITVVLALCHCLAPLYQVREGKTPVMVRMTCTKDILWQFFCGNDSLVQEFCTRKQSNKQVCEIWGSHIGPNDDSSLLILEWHHENLYMTGADVSEALLRPPSGQ